MSNLKPIDFMGMRIKEELIHADLEGNPLVPALLALRVDLIDINDEPVTLLLDEYQIDMLSAYLDARRKL